MKKRIVGIDLARIIAMFMIMNYHILMYGSWMTSKQTSFDNKVFGEFAIALTVISVDIFAMISGYVGLYSRHRLSRLLDLWFQVIFYSWLVLGFFYFFRNNLLNQQLIIHNFFPTVFKGYWYWNGYIILFILSPLISQGLKSITKKQFKTIIILLFALTSCLTINPHYDLFNLGLGYSGLWLIVLYVYGAYFKRFGIPKLLDNTLINIILLVFNLCLIVLCSYLFHHYNIWIDQNNFDTTQIQYTFPLVVSLAILVFLLLLKVKIQSKVWDKIITFLGKKSFSAYLLQTNPLIFGFLITNNYNFLRNLSLGRMIFSLIVIALFWYFGAIIIDVVRSLIWNVLRINKLFTRIEIYWKGKKYDATVDKNKL